MFEPISIVAVINEALGIVDHCINVYQTVKDTYRLFSGLEWLADELAVFRSSLRWIARDIQNCFTPQHDAAITAREIAQILQQAKREVNEIHSFLRKVVQKNFIERYADASGILKELDRLRHSKSELTAEETRTDICFLKELLRKHIPDSDKEASGYETEFCGTAASDATLDTSVVIERAKQDANNFCFEKLLKAAEVKVFKGAFGEAREDLEIILEDWKPDNGKVKVRHAAQSTLAYVCCFEANWEEAECFLEELISAKPFKGYASDAMNMLAMFYLDTNSYAEASKWAAIALQWRKAIFPVESLMCKSSEALLAEISEKQGNLNYAKAIREDMMTEFKRISLNNCKLSQECREIEKEIFRSAKLPGRLKGSKHRGDLLVLAAGEGLCIGCKFLMELGVDRDDLDNALIFATDCGQEEVVKLLIDFKANVDARDPQDKATPLLIATCKKYDSLVRLLLEKHANVHLADKYGHTALEWAVRNDNKMLVEELLDKGANTEVESSWDKKTPLIIAVEKKSYKLVELLLKGKAQINATVMKAATEDKRMIKLLKQYLLKLNYSMCHPKGVHPYILHVKTQTFSM